MLILPLLVIGLGAAIWLGVKASGRLDIQGGLQRLGAIVLAAGVLLAAFTYWFAPAAELIVLVMGLGGLFVVLFNMIAVDDGERRP